MSMQGSARSAAASSAGAKLRMEHVGMVFERDGKTISVLEDLNLDVQQGEFICVVGPSGAGKSTLLNVMGGFLSPTSGAVSIDGEAGTRTRSAADFGISGTRRFSVAYGRGEHRIWFVEIAGSGTEAAHRALCADGAAAGIRTDVSVGSFGRNEATAAGGAGAGGESGHFVSRRTVWGAGFGDAADHAAGVAADLAGGTKDDYFCDARYR